MVILALCSPLPGIHSYSTWTVWDWRRRMRRMLCSLVGFIMSKNPLSQWRDCLLLRDKDLMCHVSDFIHVSFLIVIIVITGSRASISAIQNGRAQIVNRLLELGPHRFCPRGIPRTVNYDIVPLPPTIGGGILFTVHGQVVNPHLAGPQMDHVLSVDQSFVLRKRGLEDGDE